MAITLNGTTGITTPALDSEGNLEYSGTLTGGTGVINIGSGQVVKDASGNVGVGTGAPATKLDVNGDVTQRNGTGTIIGTILNNSGFYDFNGSDNVNGAQMSHSAIVRFLTASAERVRIDASGNLLVGTTTPIGRLTVNGSCSLMGQDQVSGFASNLLLNHNGNTVFGVMIKNISTTTSNAISFMNSSNTSVGGVSVTTVSTSYLTSSDYRLKEDAKPVLNPIDRLMQLKPINFAWKVDGSRVDGFLAHEVQAVVPEAITGTKDAVETVDVTDEEGKVIGTEVKPVHQGIDQSKLVPLLTAAIQEQQTLIQALTARIEALEVA